MIFFVYRVYCAYVCSYITVYVSLLYFTSTAAVFMFLFEFYWAPARVGPLGVLSALYMFHLPAFVLLLLRPRPIGAVWNNVNRTVDPFVCPTAQLPRL